MGPGSPGLTWSLASLEHHELKARTCDSGFAPVSFPRLQRPSALSDGGGRWKILPWAVVALVAFARIYLGAHGPLDIIGGVGVDLMSVGPRT